MSNDSYKNIASKGMAFLYPVSINGQTHRENGIEHHMTVKFFDRPGVNLMHAHMAIKDLDKRVPDPSKVMVSTSMFKDRFGNNLHVLKLDGDELQHVVDNNSRLSHMGLPVKYKFSPHITVDKDIYDKVRSMKNATAADLGISFGVPELKRGHKTVMRYER